MKTLLLIVTVIGCWSSRLQSQPNTTLETLVSKNFKGERIEDDGIGMVKKFYEGGRLVRVQYCDRQGQPVKSVERSLTTQNTEWRFEYDNRGNLIRKTAYNEAGQLMDMENYWSAAIETYTYNENNQLVKLATYNKAGELIGQGELRNAFTLFRYNEKGQLIWEQDYYSNSTPIANGFGLHHYRYNEAGQLAQHTYLAEEGVVTTSMFFEYQNDQLYQKYTLGAKGQKNNLIQYLYTNNRCTKIQQIKPDGSISPLKEEAVLVNINGWALKDSDLEQLQFEVRNTGNGLTGGTYKLSVNAEGRITNIIPEQGTPAFHLDVYEQIGPLKLVKTNADAGPQTGTLKITVVRQQRSLQQHLDWVKKPTPTF